MDRRPLEWALQVHDLGDHLQVHLQQVSGDWNKGTVHRRVCQKGYDRGENQWDDLRRGDESNPLVEHMLEHLDEENHYSSM